MRISCFRVIETYIKKIDTLKRSFFFRSPDPLFEGQSPTRGLRRNEINGKFHSKATEKFGRREIRVNMSY